MANTYTLIASNTLSTSAASLTFSAIPNTFTDLVDRWSARISLGAKDQYTYIQFNGDTSTNYSTTFLYTDAVTVTSTRSSNANYYFPTDVTGDAATANTFGSAEIYIPSYTASQNKPISNFGTPETNATDMADFMGLGVTAGLWRNTAAISSIYIGASGNFLSGSSFFLYGIKNS